MLFKIALRNLQRHKRRSSVIILTIMLGVGALFAFSGFNQGMMDQYKEETIHARYGHGQVYTENYRDTVYEKPWEHWINKWEKMASLLKTRPEVTHVFPRISFSALLTKGKTSISGFGEGIDGKEEASFFNTLNFIDGHPFLSHKGNGITLGKGLADALQVKPGDTLTLFVKPTQGKWNKKNFIVSGIFHTGSQEFDQKAFRVSLFAAQDLLKTDAVETLALGLKSSEDWEKTASFIASLSLGLTAIPFSELDRIYYQHSVDWLNTQFSVMRVIILTIILLGSYNMIATGILERKQDVGNLRSNGETRWDIMKLFLIEAFFMGIIGSTLGILSTFFLSEVVLVKGIELPPAPGHTLPSFLSLHLHVIEAVKTASLGVFISLLAAFITSFRVSRMPIAKALRSF